MEEEGVLQFSDVETLLPPPPLGLDPETQASVMNFRKKIFQMRLQKVNKNFQFLSDTWPQGRPIDYFIALELCNDDINVLSEKIKVQQFTRLVLSESAQRGFPTRQAVVEKKISRSYSEFDFDSDDDNDETSDDEKGGKKKQKRGRKKATCKWEPSEISEFIFEYNNNIRNQTWTAFCSRFFGKREEDCLKLLKKLKKEGKIFREFPENIKVREDPKAKKVTLCAINFIKGDIRIRVGPVSQETEERMAMNPIPGYIDMITQKPMEIPALSPDGYALDYSTWLKLLNEKKVNPFTQNHLTSKRQLTILTIDNFDQYKDKIVNLEQCKPQND